MSTRKRLVLCIAVSALAAAAWPSVAHAGITLLDAKWPGGATYQALPAGASATLDVTVQLTGGSQWTHTSIKLSGLDWVTLTAPDPNITAPGTYTVAVTFDPQTMLRSGGVCGLWDVRVVAWSGIIPSNDFWGGLQLDVYDAAPPTITCAPLTVYLNEFGEADITANQLIAGYSDDCGIIDLYAEASLTHFTCADVDLSPIEVRVRAQDDAGHWSAWCYTEVTVMDALFPTVTCDPLKFNTDPGVCTTLMTIPVPPNADNCSVVLVEHKFIEIAGHPNFATDPTDPYYGYQDWAPGDVLDFTFPLGVSKIRWRVTDSSDHQTTCTQKVTIEDKEIPVITAGADITVEIGEPLCGPPGNHDECIKKVVVAPPVVIDNCDEATLWVDVPRFGISHAATAPECYPLGETELHWYAMDPSGNVNELPVIQKITVTTEIAPFIACCPMYAQCVGPYSPGPCYEDPIRDCEAWVNVCPPAIFDCCPPFIDYQHYGMGYMIVTHTAIGPDGQPGPFGGCFDFPCWMDECGELIDCNEDGVIDALDQDCEICPSSHKNCDWDADGWYPVGTTAITWTVLNPVTGLSASCEQLVIVEDCTPPPICCVPCFCDPVVTTYGGEDVITAADLINQFRLTLGYFPYEQSCCCESDYDTLCRGCISDNCGEAELVIISGFGPAPAYEPIEVPASTEYSAGHTFILKFLAKDPAGNYSYGLPCEVAIYVDLGQGDPPGACCFPDGTCQMLTQVDCATFAGTFSGSGTSCYPNPCPQPPPPTTGACCLVGSCVTVTEATCTYMGGAYYGGSCTPNPCPLPPGQPVTDPQSETPAYETPTNGTPASKVTEPTTTSTPSFAFCGASASLTMTLTLVGLIGLKLTRRRR